MSVAGLAWYHRGRMRWPRSHRLRFLWWIYPQAANKCAPWIIFWFGGMRCPPPAICTILTESKELFGPRLHIYHEVYLVSQAGITGEGSSRVCKRGRWSPSFAPAREPAQGQDPALGLHYYFGRPPRSSWVQPRRRGCMGADVVGPPHVCVNVLCSRRILYDHLCIW